MTYLTLFRLGLPLIERYFLCYALSRAVEEEYAIDIDQVLDDAVLRSRKHYQKPWQFWK